MTGNSNLLTNFTEKRQLPVGLADQRAGKTETGRQRPPLAQRQPGAVAGVPVVAPRVEPTGVDLVQLPVGDPADLPQRAPGVSEIHVFKYVERDGEREVPVGERQVVRAGPVQER